MTVRLKVQYGKLPANSLFTGSATEEARLLREGLADTNTAAGVAFVSTEADKINDPVSAVWKGGVPFLRFDNTETPLVVTTLLRAFDTTAATAAANIAAINDAISAVSAAGGGIVYNAAPGVVSVNGPVVQQDNVWLINGSATEIKQLPGTNKPMWVTAAFAAPTRACTLSWTSGPLLTVTLAAHGMNTQSQFVIGGVSRSQPEYNQVFGVHAVVDADHFQVLMETIPTAAPTGSPTVAPVTSNFKVSGGRWNPDYANNNLQTDITTVTAILCGRAAHGVFEDVVVVGMNKYGFNFGACNEIYTYRCGGYAPEGATAGAEVAKHYGPIGKVVHTGLTGRSTDDFSSVQPAEGFPFLDYAWTVGDILEVKYVDCDGANSGGSGTYCIFPSPDYKAHRVIYQNCRGRNTASGSALLTVQPQINGRLGVVEATGMSGSVTGAGNRGVSLNPSGNAMTADRITLRGIDIACDGETVYVFGSITGKVLEIEKVKPKSTTTTKEAVYLQDPSLWEKIVVDGILETQAASGSSYSIRLGAGLAKDLAVQNCVLSGATNRNLFLGLPSGVSKITLRNNKQRSSGTTFAQIQRLPAGSTLNVHENGGDALYGLNMDDASGVINCTLNATNNDFPNASQGFIRLVNNSGAANNVVVDYRGSGNAFPAGAGMFAFTGGANKPIFKVRDWGFPVDIGSDGMVKTDAGQFCFNTAARGTIAVNSLVSCSATQWSQLNTPTNVF